jgi:hypothetical protein
MDEPSIDLSTYDQTTLSRWWCELMTFRWPADFPLPRPEGWDGMNPTQRDCCDDMWSAFQLVKNAVSLEAALAYWRGPYQRGRSRPTDPEEADPHAAGTWHDRPSLL